MYACTFSRRKVKLLLEILDLKDRFGKNELSTYWYIPYLVYFFVYTQRYFLVDSVYPFYSLGRT